MRPGGLFAAAIIAGAVLAARPALAAVDCSALPNPVYAQIDDSQEPLFKQFGYGFRNQAPSPVTIVWRTSGSCTNVDAARNGTKLTTNLSYVPSTAEDPAWNFAQPAPTCTVDPAGVLPDILVTSIFPSLCGDPLPAAITQTKGPISARVLAVPKASTQHAITFEEAYFAFGYGKDGGATPWTFENELFIRTTTKATMLTWSSVFAVPPGKLRGIRSDKAAEVVSQLASSANPEQSLGMLDAGVVDANRDLLRALAFQAKGQQTAYFPDSTEKTQDKQNVRDGHYTVWSSSVFMTLTTSNPRVNAVIDAMTARSTAKTLGFSPVTLDVVVGMVPDCAMRVSRDSEGGDLSLYTPLAPCGCEYDRLTNSASSCAECSDTKACTAGVCRSGFCEAK